MSYKKFTTLIFKLLTNDNPHILPINLDTFFNNIHRNYNLIYNVR